MYPQNRNKQMYLHEISMYRKNYFVKINTVCAMTHYYTGKYVLNISVMKTHMSSPLNKSK